MSLVKRNPLKNLWLACVLGAAACGTPEPELLESHEDALRFRYSAWRVRPNPVPSPLGTSIGVSSRIRREISSSADLTRVRFVRNQASLIGRSSGQLNLKLFDDVELNVRRNGFSRSRSGISTWVGDVDGFVGHPVNILKSGNSVFGKVVHGDHVYVIRTVANGVIAIEEFRRNAQTSCGNDLVSDRNINLQDLIATTRLQIERTGTVDLMVAYTTASKLASGLGISSLGTVMMKLQIQLAVAEMNAALSRSDIRHRVRLVHTQEIDGSEIENSDSRTQLRWIKAKMNDPGDEIYVARERANADVVSLWVEKSENACGRGYVYDLRENFDEYATHMVVRSCQITKYSFLHEFGHNLGGNHDWAVSTADEPYIYSHGYVLWDVNFPMIPVRTLMAYDDLCEDVGVLCPRVPVFSNPDYKVLGYPLGISYADVHRTINNTGYRVSQFR